MKTIILYLKGLLLLTERVPYFTMQVSTTWIPGVLFRGVIVFTDFQIEVRLLNIMISGVQYPSKYSVWHRWNNINSIPWGHERFFSLLQSDFMLDERFLLRSG
jgi:hypothetical protein